MSIQDVLRQHTSQSPQMNQLNSLIGTIKGASDPQAMINQMVLSNPLVQKAQQVAQQYGGLEQAVRAVAQQKGIDLQTVFNQLKSM